jgi:tetratricopeptide (TPR) repeat protein
MHLTGAYNKLGKKEETDLAFKLTVEVYTKSIEIDPRCEEAYYARAAHHFMFKRYEESIPDLTRTLELSPDNAVARLRRGVARFHAGRFAEAVADLEPAIRAVPAWEGDTGPLLEEARRRAREER